PHLINLTATPIPRTLALGLFGEIEITNIPNKPKNHLPVKTWVVNPTRFKKSDSWLQDRLKAGSKVFVISPLIHSSEKAKDLASTEKIRQIYQRKFGEKFPVHLIHGQLKPDKIEAELKLFRQAITGILVSTTLIEVGIDIPEADVIIIHSAERFGLAQLHQLRGRVGRGHRQGYCLLVPTTDDQQEEERLKLLEKYHSGLVLAKKDLKLRGAGELFGEKQHGWIPVRLKNFWNKNLFLKAKKTATEMVALDQNESLAIANKLVTW
ncbi:DNA helicase RecG, partial [Candidatus Collierbacteria bacterium]|nr:DNA helicase RecG [Candidatus Collierbacteria bacterium]